MPCVARLRGSPCAREDEVRLAVGGVLGDALNRRDAADAAWVSALAERLAAAQAVAPALSGRLLTRQHRWTASCQCNVTLGPDGLRAAAKRAAATRRSTRLRP